MAKLVDLLSKVKLENLPAGTHSDGGGLNLLVKSTGGRSWVAYIFFNGKRCEIGLGAWPAVKLSQAREACRKKKEGAKAGIDPRPQRAVEEAPAAPVENFRSLADRVIADLAPTWHGAKTRQGWENCLYNHARPLATKTPQEIETADVLAILKPIWFTVPEVAQKTQKRIERVLDVARVEGLRKGDNPARWVGHLDVIFERQSLTRGHHASLDYAQASAFFADLRERDGEGAAGLEFAVLTGGRSAEVLKMPWPEIDFAASEWRIPRERCKNRKAMKKAGFTHHIVPLSPAAIALLERQKAKQKGEPQPWVFPGIQAGQSISTGTMDAVLKRMKVKVTVHGFRSTFRTWAGEALTEDRFGQPIRRFSTEACESAIGHITGSTVVRAYARSNYLEERRPLMVAWANFLEGKIAVPTAGGSDAVSVAA